MLPAYFVSSSSVTLINCVTIMNLRKLILNLSIIKRMLNFSAANFCQRQMEKIERERVCYV